MKGIDWGRIMARLLAVWLLTEFVGGLAGTMSILDSLGELAFNWPLAVFKGSLIAICVLLWTGVFTLTPPSKEEPADSLLDSKFAARAIVMCAGLWFLLFYGAKAAAMVFYNVSRNSAEWQWTGIHPTFVLHVVAALVGAVLIVFPSVILGRAQE